MRVQEPEGGVLWVTKIQWRVISRTTRRWHRCHPVADVLGARPYQTKVALEQKGLCEFFSTKATGLLIRLTTRGKLIKDLILIRMAAREDRKRWKRRKGSDRQIP